MNDARYYGPPLDSDHNPIRINKPKRKQPRRTPQSTVTQFWTKFNTRFPGKVFNVLPSNYLARKKVAAKKSQAQVRGQRAARSYDDARADCIRDVDRIIRECRRTNQKYRDPHFDIEWDLKSHQRNCIDGLAKIGDGMKPKGVHRVTHIFKDPQFYINGPTAGDVKQGRDGDCYLMAALCGLGNMKGLIEKVCVKQDLQVGVYGFVFFRDGEWQHTIVDDKLYLRAPDYNEATNERIVWDDINRTDSEEEYRKAHQTGSRALYFAQCSDENEIWLPLLEKAYAKSHGDYASIDGGFTGEAIEDLTGGVTTELYSTDILDREAFWRDELMQVNKNFLFGCATGFYTNWLDTTGSNTDREREGISEGHAYSIMDAREVKGYRLLKLRNPWGKKEWDGKWSDGSGEWDAEWLQALDHKFGNDGIFWISYEDLLKKYQHFDRTRIFGPEWNVSQCWTTVQVPWSTQYLKTKFSLTLNKKAPVVIVLSQLDEKYFDGLQGNYLFDLQFRLEDANSDDQDDYIVRSNGAYAMGRSVSTDIELEAGTYNVLIKITATKDKNKDALEEVLTIYASARREKLIQIGLSYDLAHAKGVYVETKDDKKERKRIVKEKRADRKERSKQAAREQAEKQWKKEKAKYERLKERKLRRTWSTRAQSTSFNDGTEQDDVTKSNNSRSNNIRFAGGVEQQVQDLDQARARGSGCLPASTGQQLVEEKMGRVAISEGRSSEATIKAMRHLVVNDTVQEQIGLAPMSLDEVVTTFSESTLEPVSPSGKKHNATSSGEIQGRKDARYRFHDTLHDLPYRPANPNALPGSTFKKDDDSTDNASIKSFPPFDWDTDLDMPNSYDSDSSSSSSSSSSSNSSDTSTISSPPHFLADHFHRPPYSPHHHQRRRRPTNRHDRSPTRYTYPPTTFRDPIINNDNNNNYNDKRDRPPPFPLALPLHHSTNDNDDDDRTPSDPWNAICIVGLRVFSTLSSNELGLKVVRPADPWVEWRDRMKGREERKEKKKQKKDAKLEKKTQEENEKEKEKEKEGEKMRVTTAEIRHDEIHGDAGMNGGGVVTDFPVGVPVVGGGVADDSATIGMEEKLDPDDVNKGAVVCQ